MLTHSMIDDPSSHLDVATRESLSAALAGYGGSMLLVSHDRHLLRTTVDRFWIIADGQLTEFDGDLDDYRDWLADYQSRRRSDNRREDIQQHTNDVPLDRRAQRRAEAQARQPLS